MLIKKDSNRKAAYDSVINTFLKDTQAYCYNCGSKHDERNKLKYICCGDPMVGNHMDHAKVIIKQNKEIQKSRMNQHASSADKSLRWGVSLPTWLYSALDEYEKSLSTPEEPGRRLFRSAEDVRWFAKNYPQFAIPERM